MTVGDNIRYYREKQMISQKELSKLTGLASGTISRYELDKVIPKMKNIELIAKALKIHKSQLLTTNPPSDIECLSYEELTDLIISFCKENKIAIFRKK